MLKDLLQFEQEQPIFSSGMRASAGQSDVLQKLLEELYFPDETIYTMPAHNTLLT